MIIKVVLYLIILISILHSNQASFCSKTDFCNCSSTKIPFDEQVYDPSTSIIILEDKEKNIRFKKLFTNMNPNFKCDNQNIQQRSSSSSSSSSSTRRVKFSEPLETFEPVDKQIDPLLISIRATQKSNPNPSSIVKLQIKSPVRSLIFPEEPFNYNVDDLSIDNWFEVFIDDSFDEFIDLINEFYLGLRKFKISLLDLSGLILFASFRKNSSTSAFFKNGSLSNFFKNFIKVFPESFVLINSMQILVENENFKQIDQAKALKHLFYAAFKSKCYYTIEAFYTKFGLEHIDVFVEKSLIEGDMRLFIRFFFELPEVKSEILINWELKYGSIPFHNSITALVPSVDQISIFLNCPILFYVAKNNYHFEGLVRIVAESKNLDEALFASIQFGNFKLFKDLITYKNDYFPSFNPNVLNVLRSIYTYTHEDEDVATISTYNIDSEEELREIVLIILSLDCADKNVLQVFKDLLNENFASRKLFNEMFQSSLFMKTREYFKHLLMSSSQLKFTLSIEASKPSLKLEIGLWEIFRYTKHYDELMTDLSNSPSFFILHAIANPSFPKSLWPKMFEKFNLNYIFQNKSYKELSQEYAFNTDILSENDLEIFSDMPSDKKHWNLLELAILNFNSVAVEMLLSHEVTLVFDLIKSKTLAKALHTLIQSEEYLRTHQMPNISIKRNFIQEKRMKYPNLFNQSSNLGSIDRNVLIIKAEIYIKKIIAEIEKNV